MNIAIITITYNDEYKLNEWYRWYLEYRDAVSLHIIVDNNSEKAYKQKVRDLFTESHIIERKSNGGCTGAYNDGIKVALSHPEIDTILLLGNDIRITANSILVLYDFLFSKEEFGMVSPIILSPKTGLIECYGSKLNWLGINMRPYIGLEFNDTAVPDYRIVEYVTGGINLSKRSFYEIVGLQDEKLFMYADELDMYHRAKSKGFVEAVTCKSHAWHCHINPDSDTIRKPLMYYLHGRNVVYLFKKHYPKKWLFLSLTRFVFSFIAFVLHLFDKDQRIIFIQHCKGYWAGLRNNMDNSFIQ